MVYIDDLNKKSGRMLMCHMIAENSFELIKMAKRIGVHPRHLQHPGTPKEHFDISKGAKAKALAYGAIGVSKRTLARMISSRKAKLHPYPFTVGNKAVKINATSLANAIDRVTALYPNKRINTTFARNMDKHISKADPVTKERTVTWFNGMSRGSSIISEEDMMIRSYPEIEHKITKVKNKFFMELQKARKEAAAKSKSKQSTVYVNVKPAGDPDEGDCFLSDKTDDTTYSAFKNGNEIAVSVKLKPAEKATTKKTVKVDAVEKSADNKSNSKVMAKTAEKAAKKAAPKKVATKEVAKAPKGKKNIAIKEIIKLIKGGTKVYNHADKILTLGYMEKMKDPSRQMPVSY